MISARVISVCLLAIVTLVAQAKSQTKLAFVHPGLLHTEADFVRMRAKVNAGNEPWKSGWDLLVANPHASLNWKPRPLETVVRGGGTGENYRILYNDVHAAYQCALRWKISGDTAYAEKSIEILNAWSSTLKKITGSTDSCLAAGLYGYQFANAAEIMRTYPKWAKQDFVRFQNMMLTVFYPMNHGFLTVHNGTVASHYWANWDLCNIASLISIGVLCDRRDIYDEGILYFKYGVGNGSIRNAIYYLHDGNLGQWQESGRDQGHNTLGIVLMAPICETAWNQGDDLYGYDNNRFLAGAEYVAKYNLGNDVPYLPYIWGAGHRGDRKTQELISEGGRGLMRAGWELVYNHYVNRKGLAAPYTTICAAKVRPEGGGGNYGPNSGGFDQLGFGTLTASLDPITKPTNPSGLTARLVGGKVVLNWWGAAGISNYHLKRSTSLTGPFTTIASNVKDSLSYVDDVPKQGTYYYIATGILASGEETAPSAAAEIKTLPTQLNIDFVKNVSRVESDSKTLAAVLKGGAVQTRVGDAIIFDGLDDYASLPEGILSNLADFTIAAWINISDERKYSRVFDFGDGVDRYLYLTPRAGTNRVRFAVGTVHGFNEQFIESDQAISTGKWVHVAITLSGRSGSLYIDGKLAGKNENIDFAPYRVGYTRYNWIGRSQYAQDPYFKGSIDDFRIYSGALTDDEVAALAKSR